MQFGGDLCRPHSAANVVYNRFTRRLIPDDGGWFNIRLGNAAKGRAGRRQAPHYNDISVPALPPDASADLVSIGQK